MNENMTPGPHTVRVREVLVAFEGRVTEISIPELGMAVEFNQEAPTKRVERAKRDATRAAAAPEMLEALRRVEWAGSIRGIGAVCPACLEPRPAAPGMGHLPDCYLRASIAKATGGEP